MRRGRALFLIVAAGGFAMTPAAAAPQGCEVTTLGNTGGACRYTATGPGSFEVKTLSGYRIEASDDGGKTWHALASKIARPGMLLDGFANEKGTFASKAGELISVAIAQATWDSPNGTIRYQDGQIKAGDAA